MLPDGASVTIIIPAHNEADEIGKIVREIAAIDPAFDILVVDDGSRDKTAEKRDRSRGTRDFSSLQHRQRGRPSKPGRGTPPETSF